jgi:hypothetical protein
MKQHGVNMNKLEIKKIKILNKLDRANGFSEKLEILNKEFLRAKTRNEEDVILDMIERLKFFGK